MTMTTACRPAPDSVHATGREKFRAHHYGVAAALCDRPAAPGAHAPLLAMLEGRPVGERRTTQLMEAWQSGYGCVVDAAADAVLAETVAPPKGR